MKIRKALLGGALAAGLLLPVNAEAWESNRFVSPSGNIRCVYRQWNESITCATGAPRRSVTLYNNGRTAIARAYLAPRGPVLRYGEEWEGTYTNCYSWFGGMACGNGLGGFEISRQQVATW